MFTNFMTGGVPLARAVSGISNPTLLARVQALSAASLRERTARDSQAGEENPTIPSGYTYLLQFVAHDLVVTEKALWGASASRNNLRTQRLMLNALYGEAGADPRLLDANGDFVIGALTPANNVTPVCPFRDLQRAPRLNGFDPGAVAGDTRSDDHPIIAQLTTVFALLHNAFRSLSGSFAIAQQASRLVYRHVVRNDLLKRILPTEVFDYYTGPGRVFLDTHFAGNPAAPLPVEFSHGAFRFGHAMVRPRYELNEMKQLPNHGGALLPENLRLTMDHPERPVGANWAVNWSCFFALPGAGPPANFSMRLRPAYQQVLRTPGLLTPPLTVPPSNAPLDPTGLMERDLLSAGFAQTLPLATLVAGIKGHPHWATVLPGRLADGNWKVPIAIWLQGHDMPAVDAGALAADPPLPFFVLFEASEETGGLTLGLLGGLLVADVLFAVLAQGGSLAVNEPPGPGASLAPLSPAFAGIAPIATMPDVIGFVANHHGLGAAVPGFCR